MLSAEGNAASRSRPARNPAELQAEHPATISAWVADDVYQRVTAAARQVGTERIKPIFLALGEKVPYDDIRLVLAHLEARGGNHDQGQRPVE